MRGVSPCVGWADCPYATAAQLVGVWMHGGGLCVALFWCVNCIIMMSVALLSGIEHCLGLPAVAELPATGAGIRELATSGEGAGVPRSGLPAPVHPQSLGQKGTWPRC